MQTFCHAAAAPSDCNAGPESDVRLNGANRYYENWELSEDEWSVISKILAAQGY